ncbi:MAG TPA: hypothetical protein VIH25_14200 [Steroidobacteraceae bacterium]
MIRAARGRDPPGPCGVSGKRWRGPGSHHRHAPPCVELPDGAPALNNPATGKPSVAVTSTKLRRASLAALEQYNIVKAVTSGPAETVAQWHAAAPDRIIVGAFVDEAHPLPDLAKLRAEIEAGRVQVIGELGLVPHGGREARHPLQQRRALPAAWREVTQLPGNL